MTYEVGETVVYPHHGAARIIDIRQRKVRGEEKTYLQLEVAQGDLTILVPAESVELIGVRDVVDETGLEKVFEVLRAPLTEEPTNWSRRFKACWPRPVRSSSPSWPWPRRPRRRRPSPAWTRSSPPEPFRARAQAVTHTVASCP